MFVFKGFDLTALSYSGFMAFIDVFVLGAIKAYNLGWLKGPGIIPLAMLLYSFQPLIFLKSLSEEIKKEQTREISATANLV